MSWLDALLRELNAGRHVRLRGSGPSMKGRIEDGDFITIGPLREEDTISLGDILLVRVPSGRYLAHMVQQIEGERYLIGNTLGEIDGWVSRQDIAGRVVCIGDDPIFQGLTLDDRT